MTNAKQTTKRATLSPKKSLDIPADLQAVLTRTAGAYKAFLALSPSHQREYLKWIDEAKRDETRAKRIASTVEKLASSSK